MNFEGRPITLHDMCLRDGMHPKQHQITVDEMVDIAGALDTAGVPGKDARNNPNLPLNRNERPLK